MTEVEAHTDDFAWPSKRRAQAGRKPEPGTQEWGLLVSHVLSRAVPSLPKNVLHSRKRNRKHRDAFRPPTGFLDSLCRAGGAKPNQFHGFTWFGVTLSGKSLLPRQFCAA